MRFLPTDLAGAYLIEPEPISDERGFFARTFCAEEFAAHGLAPVMVQGNLSYNAAAGTLRGLHYQAPPHAEAKLVRCVRGAIFDVIVDLRAEAPTYLRPIAVELSAANRRALYVPERFAHGFQTLAADTEVEYLVSAPYERAAGRGLRYDDPTLAIAWPLPIGRISEQDRRWPLLTLPTGVPA